MSGFSLDIFESSVKQIREGLWMFPSTKGSNGTIAWWLNSCPEPVLIDCPEIDSKVINDLKKLSQGLSPKILLTNRDSHGKVSQLNKIFGWPVLVQEQEGYLLPAINNLESFEHEIFTSSQLRLIWTPGPTPGSCVIHAPEPWNVLFCGRLLTPVAKHQIDSLRDRKTFHWTMQQKSLEKLRLLFPPNHRPSLASGVNSELLGDEKLLPWEAWK